jgi:hypothetical protein
VCFPAQPVVKFISAASGTSGKVAESGRPTGIGRLHDGSWICSVVLF